jgi:hypothetical protein
LDGKLVPAVGERLHRLVVGRHHDVDLFASHNLRGDVGESVGGRRRDEVVPVGRRLPQGETIIVHADDVGSERRGTETADEVAAGSGSSTGDEDPDVHDLGSEP